MATPDRDAFPYPNPPRQGTPFQLTKYTHIPHVRHISKPPPPPNPYSLYAPISELPSQYSIGTKVRVGNPYKVIKGPIGTIVDYRAGIYDVQYDGTEYIIGLKIEDFTIYFPPAPAPEQLSPAGESSTTGTGTKPGELAIDESEMIQVSGDSLGIVEQIERGIMQTPVQGQLDEGKQGTGFVEIGLNGEPEHSSPPKQYVQNDGKPPKLPKHTTTAFGCDGGTPPLKLDKLPDMGTICNVHAKEPGPVIAEAGKKQVKKCELAGIDMSSEVGAGGPIPPELVTPLGGRIKKKKRYGKGYRRRFTVRKRRK